MTVALSGGRTCCGITHSFEAICDARTSSPPSFLQPHKGRPKEESPVNRAEETSGYVFSRVHPACFWTPAIYRRPDRAVRFTHSALFSPPLACKRRLIRVEFHSLLPSHPVPDHRDGSLR